MNQCCQNVYRPGGSYRGSPCHKKAVVQNDGNWYCSTHDPEKVKARHDKSYAEYTAKHNREMAAHDLRSAAMRFCEGVDAETLKTSWRTAKLFRSGLKKGHSEHQNSTLPTYGRRPVRVAAVQD